MEDYKKKTLAVYGIVISVMLFTIALAGAALASELRSGVSVDGYIELDHESVGLFDPSAQRFVDQENGIICWVFREYAGNGITGGISCVKK